jgi:pyridoxine 5-phosphate synthase
MAQFELNLDAFLACRNQLDIPSLSLPGVVTIAHLSGADGFSISFDARSKSFTEHDLEVLTSTAADARINLHIAPRADLMQVALDLPVQQVTFVGEDLFKNYGGDLENFTPQLKAAGKLVSYRVEPELSELKKAYRLHADFIEMNVTSFTGAPNPVQQAESQEQFALMARTAEKNGMGVAVAGGIGYSTALPLISIESVENMIVGRAIMARAIFVGLETAIRDFKGTIL